MRYSVMFKGSIVNFPFLLSVGFIIVLVGISGYVALVDPGNRMPMDIVGVFSALLGWGVASIIKRAICRRSTLMIPNLRRSMTDFYISFGIFMIFVLSLATFFPLNIHKELTIDFAFFSFFVTLTVLSI